jgi:hypothetical protein
MILIGGPRVDYKSTLTPAATALQGMVFNKKKEKETQ